MYEAFRKLIVAVVNIWLAHEDGHNKSVYYVRREDLDADDPFQDERLSNGKIVRVTIEVADDDTAESAT